MAASLSAPELYDKLSRYVMPVERLDAYGYPSRDPEFNDLLKIPIGKDGQKLVPREKLASNYECHRCRKTYRVDGDGIPLPTEGECFYHQRNKKQPHRNRWICCEQPYSVLWCNKNRYHVHESELELYNYKGFVETQAKPEREPNKHGIYALDCEMCHTTYGFELIKVIVVNHKEDVAYEKLVKPSHPILDYNTKFSGVKESDLENVETTLADVQRDLLELFSSRTILIGHSLDNDMKALKIFHKRFIDTAQLFPHSKGLPYKKALRTIVKDHLRVQMQQGVTHDSKENIIAALRLVMYKANLDR